MVKFSIGRNFELPVWKWRELLVHVPSYVYV